MVNQRADGFRGGTFLHHFSFRICNSDWEFYNIGLAGAAGTGPVVRRSGLHSACWLSVSPLVKKFEAEEKPGGCPGPVLVVFRNISLCLWSPAPAFLVLTCAD